MSDKALAVGSFADIRSISDLNMYATNPKTIPPANHPTFRL